MKIAVAHHSLNIPGGAERLSLAVIDALQRRGHSVTLVSVEKTNWAVVHRNFGDVPTPDEESYVTTSRVSDDLANMSISLAYFIAYVMKLLACKTRNKYDVTINTFGDVINSIADLTYVHFPLRAAMALSQIPAFSHRSIWRAIDPLYDLAMLPLDSVCPGELLTNSRFMQGIIKETLHRNSAVVYPPVDTGKFITRAGVDEKEDGTVAIVASYTPKRHLEQVPLVARHTKAAKFTIMGKADEYSIPILRKLKAQIDTLHVQNRVKILTSVPFDEYRKTLSASKVYLHVMPFDHFGISVVEAMAAGCVPVVHRSGGPWLDILDGRQGKYGFSYVTPEEAARSIDALVTNEDSRAKIASEALERAKRFDRAVFMQRMVEVVERNAN